MESPSDTRSLRSFGLLVGGVFALLGFWPVVWRGGTMRPWAVLPAIVLVGLGICWPRALAPIHRVWMQFGHALGWFNTRVLLGIVYYGVLSPMALVMRFLGKDPLRRSFSPAASTYREPRTPRSPRHLHRQF